MKQLFSAVSVIILLLLFPVSNAISKDLDDNEIKAVTQACLDYVEGFYESNKERIERGVHEELVKREASGNVFSIRTRESLIKNSLSSTKIKPSIKVEVHDIHKNIASACVISQFVDYCQLAKIDGNWKVVNVLWVWK